MTVYRNYGMEVAPPSDYTRYGEGNFLIQHFGKSMTFSKNGRTWYTKYDPVKKLDIARAYSLNDTTTNDNDKIINSAYFPLKINFLYMRYIATSTVGDRNLNLTVLDTDDVASDAYFIALQTASQNKRYMLVPEGTKVTGSTTDFTTLPISFDFTKLFNSAIRINDYSDVDDNDDLYIWARGWEYSHKHLCETVVENCSDLQIEYQASANLEGSSYGWFLNVIPLP